MATQQQIIDRIPLYQSGDQQGKAINENLRELHRLLKTYTCDQHELDMIEKDVMANIPKRTLEKRRREAAEGYNV